MTYFKSPTEKYKFWRPFEETSSSIGSISTPKCWSHPYPPPWYHNLGYQSCPIAIPRPLYPRKLELSSDLKSTIELRGKKANLVATGNSSFHPVKRKRVSCPHCTSKFYNNGQLTGHLTVHNRERPFRCSFDKCPRSFARNEELTRHLRIHTGDKPHVCDLCPKRFGRKDHLSKHRRTHQRLAEKKVHLCPLEGCGHSYTRSDALARHIGAAHDRSKRITK